MQDLPQLQQRMPALQWSQGEVRGVGGALQAWHLPLAALLGSTYAELDAQLPVSDLEALDGLEVALPAAPPPLPPRNEAPPHCRAGAELR